MSKFEFILRIIGLVVVFAIIGVGFVLMAKKGDDPTKIILKAVFSIPFAAFCVWMSITTGPFGLIMIGLMAVVLAYMWTPHLSEWISSPLTSILDGGTEPIERKPFYSIAHAKRKRGIYTEAVAEVRKQLERFPNDFEGTILLASIQAENLQDLSAAEHLLETGINKNKWPNERVAASWTQLADWHLHLGMDVAAARASLQKIVDRFPGSELALKAEQRIAHLVETDKHLQAKRENAPVAVPQGVHNLGLRDAMKIAQPPEIEPGKLAQAYVNHLAAHPHDSEVREKLAVIYAKDFQRLDLATMELSTLINESRHSAKQIAGWLNLLANFQVELGMDIETVRGTLQQIVERFPQLPLAQVTQRRLGRLDSEFKGKKETPGMKLGVYEQNIGLKYGGPRKQE